MILIDAVYIHESGGLVLLKYLIQYLQKDNIPFFLLLDKRLPASLKEEIPEDRYQQIESREEARKQFYRKLPSAIQTIFCFANVPPPVAVKDRPVFILFQNVLLVSKLSERNLYPFKQKLLFLGKRWYIRYRSRKNYRWVVQTPSMKRRLAAELKLPEESISIIPFFPGQEKPGLPSKHDPSKFIYVADGVPQKNHLTLLEAWEILYEKYQVTPELHLTIPERFIKLIERVNALQNKGLKISNHSFLNRAELEKLYQECGYLIFPSLAESFGLPLLEAANAGCGVLAVDLEYVNDVVIPSAKFISFSAADIAEKVLDASKLPQPKTAGVVITNSIEQLLILLHKNVY